MAGKNDLDLDDVAAPADYERPQSKRLAKMPPDDKKALADAGDAEAIAKAAKATSAAPPASLDHGRPKGAGNALAFHAFKKSPKKDGES